MSRLSFDPIPKNHFQKQVITLKKEQQKKGKRPTNEKRVTLKSLKDEINDLKEQLKLTKTYVEGMEEKLSNATKEIDKLKGITMRANN